MEGGRAPTFSANRCIWGGGGHGRRGSIPPETPRPSSGSLVRDRDRHTSLSLQFYCMFSNLRVDEFQVIMCHGLWDLIHKLQ
ncbi:hypothetical protein [Phormidium sp. CCY1219]|uniref:hypothetical protein n=1 Tax=Phormidium sp. CCY1219 TaxID=2886104 RepID=UPI002D1E5BB8|nr:hypothetical protein [Phormidium sp. CCY1219]MEB3827720.1 hypothetical protein [Phormidium sp. CCY1219]